MEAVIAFSGVAVILLYCLVLIQYGNALRDIPNERFSHRDESGFRVSVIVPVRNEINSLPYIINDLSEQDYPTEHFEVLFVDDHSDDGSAEYLKKICRERRNFRLLSLDGKIYGKKEAISLGSSFARYSWIIQTDADCRIPVEFIRGHASMAASGKPVLIAGPVLTIPVKGLWNKFESIEMMSLTGTGMASFLLGRPVMCSGANLSYSRSFYEAVKADLLAVPSASGDDMFLMIQAKRHQKSFAYLASPRYIVSAVPTGTIGSFISQRVRWGSKARYYADRDLLSLSLLVWISNAILFFYLVASLLHPFFIPFFIASWFMKSFADFILLHLTARIFRRKQLLTIFPLAALFYYFYVTLAGALSLVGRYSWKGREYGAHRIS
jgi:poly-beta-1,6-N-acetyl-D-glucosamine synthase